MNSTDDLNIINQITRRQWILRLGETVALAGVSGILPESPLRLFSAQQNYAALPPGLYEPTPDDLVHALSSHKSFTPPVGSETDYVQPGARPTLQFFSAEDFRTMSGFVSVLLGDVEPKVVSETGQWVDLLVSLRRRRARRDPKARSPPPRTRSGILRRGIRQRN